MDSGEEERGASARKRRRSDFIDDDDDDLGGRADKRSQQHKRMSASKFLDVEAVVDSDEGEEEEEGEDDFIVDDGGANLLEEDDGRRMLSSCMLSLDQEDHEDLEAIERSIQERYGRCLIDYDEEITDVELQALLPSVRDPSLWMVKCMIGHERETAVCLMQKNIDKGSELQIRSVVALDHLKNYIYVEAYKEAHVREACKGLRNIFAQKITLVPIREMTDVLSVESKAIDLARDTWVRMKIGTYKGDIAKVVDIDNVRQRVTVKLIPRIDLQALANKLEGREVVKKKAFVPPRFMNVDEARELHIRVEHRCDNYGDRFEAIGGLMFKAGFLYKTVSMKSISAKNIKPTLDELEKFHKPGEKGDGDVAKLSNLLTNRKKRNFMKGDAVIAIKGDLKNLKGWVEKVDEDIVHIRPAIKDLPKTIALNKKELCKYFEPGNHVKVVSGAREGATGLVVKVEQRFLIIMSDATKDHIHVFADDVVESSEVTTGVTIIDSGQRHRGRRVHDGLAGATVKIRQGAAHRKHIRVHDGLAGATVKIRQGAAHRKHICVNKTVTPQHDISQYGTGSETPMHPSRTPFNPHMTPMRDLGATPIQSGMRTPMHD